jgi:hypothetical protein
VISIKGNFMLGLNLVFVSLYPMRPGATMMSSMMVNTALILMQSCAVIQFCAQAFADYAKSTAIFDIFGNQVGPAFARPPPPPPPRPPAAPAARAQRSAAAAPGFWHGPPRLRAGAALHAQQPAGQ